MTSSGSEVSAKDVNPRRSRKTTAALEGILGIPADDHFGELGGEEALEAREALELSDLRLHALLKGPVPLGELVVEQLDPQERLHPREQLRLVDGLGEEVVGARLDPLHALLPGIERGHHDDGERCGRRVTPDLAADLITAHLGHDDVEQH